MGKMGNFNIQKSDIGKEKKEERHTKQGGHGRCSVYGCNRMGHFYGGNWNCRYHEHVSGKNLASVTSRIKNHELEINWFEHILQSSFVDYKEGFVDSSKIISTEGSHGGCWERSLTSLNAAPYGMKPNEGEGFFDYRKRMGKHIDFILNHTMEAA